MQRTLTPLAFALVLAFGASIAQAQSIVDGSSNTILPPGGNLRQPGVGLRDGSVRTIGVGGGASLTVKSEVSSDITQSAQGSGREGQTQIVSIGGARDLTANGGTVSAQGSQSIGSLVQTRNGNAGTTSALQNITIGSVSGQLSAANVQAVGSSLGSVNQTATNGGGRQDVDIGGISDVTGGSFRSSGLLNANITQAQNGALQQEVSAGAIRRATLQDARTESLINASITQTGGGRGATPLGGQQRVDVGSISDVQGQSVTALGTLNGEVVQTQGDGVTQTVAIGSVANLASAQNISTNGVAQGKVTQTAVGNGLQELLVATVRGGAPTIASTNVNLTGDVSQTSAGRLGTLQRIAVGAIENAGGRVSTNAIVSGRLTQAAGASAAASQSILLGSVLDSNAN